MGKKGDRLTQQSIQTAEELVRRLGPLGKITSRKMFGGHGIFESGVMFAIVDSSGRLFLKADDPLREKFEAAGGTRHGRMPYFSAPEEVLGRDRDLRAWAQRSIAASKG